MPQPTGYPLAVLLSELHAARNPNHIQQDAGSPDDVLQPPSSINSGVSLTDATNGHAIYCNVSVYCRRRTAREVVISFPEVNNSATYALEVTGPSLTGSPVAINFVSSGSATANEIVLGLKAAIEANAALTAYIEAEEDPTDSTQLLLRGRIGDPSAANPAANEEHWILTALTNSGGTDPSAVGDALSCDVVVRGYPAGHPYSSGLSPNPTTDVTASASAYGRTWWRALRQETRPSSLAADPEGEYVSFRGGLDPYKTAGFNRIHVWLKEIKTLSGESAVDMTLRTPEVWIGRCFRESLPGA